MTCIFVHIREPKFGSVTRPFGAVCRRLFGAVRRRLFGADRRRRQAETEK